MEQMDANRVATEWKHSMSGLEKRAVCNLFKVYFTEDACKSLESNLYHCGVERAATIDNVCRWVSELHILQCGAPDIHGAPLSSEQLRAFGQELRAIVDARIRASMHTYTFDVPDVFVLLTRDDAQSHETECEEDRPLEEEPAAEEEPTSEEDPVPEEE